MTQALAETTHFENAFGTVTDRRVVYLRKKGWFSGGSREDVPLRHVTSVRVDIVRSVIVGVVLLMIGVMLIVFIVGIVPLFFGVMLLWGSPTVVVSTSGANQEFMTGWPWHRQEAEAFSNALRQQLFRD